MTNADEANEIISLLKTLSNRLVLPPVDNSKDVGRKRICSEVLEALMPAHHPSPIDETDYEFSIFRLELNTPHNVEKRIERAIDRLTNVYHQVALRIANEFSEELRKRKARLASDNQELPFSDPRFSYKLEQYFQAEFDKVVERLQTRIQDAVASLFPPQTKRLSKVEGDAILRNYYAHNTHPDGDTKWRLAKQTNRTYEQIGTWFCNRRTRHGETIRRDHAVVREATLSKSKTPEKRKSRGHSVASVAESSRQREQAITITVPDVDNLERTKYHAEQYELLSNDEDAAHDGFFGDDTDCSDTESMGVQEDVLSHSDSYAKATDVQEEDPALPYLDDCGYFSSPKDISSTIGDESNEARHTDFQEENIHHGEVFDVESLYMTMRQLEPAHQGIFGTNLCDKYLDGLYAEYGRVIKSEKF